MFSIAITYDNASLEHIYGPRFCFTHPTDGRIQLAMEPVDLLTYEDAQRAFFTASDWLDEMMREGLREGNASTVTLRGPNGIFRSHTFSKALTLDKPAHPNLYTNV